ncbi:hypothetical protein SFR_3015 [Streptomyces sp. FR-008]|nr:hypothetical protein SFR_3015 [Streptomyces sp. FR-008]
MDGTGGGPGFGAGVGAGLRAPRVTPSPGAARGGGRRRAWGSGRSEGPRRRGGRLCPGLRLLRRGHRRARSARCGSSGGGGALGMCTGRA